MPPTPETAQRRRERAVEIVSEYTNSLGASATTAANIVRELIDAGLIVDDLGAYYHPADRVADGKTSHRIAHGIDARDARSIADRVAVLESRVDDVERAMQTIAEGFTR